MTTFLICLALVIGGAVIGGALIGSLICSAIIDGIRRGLNR